MHWNRNIDAQRTCWTNLQSKNLWTRIRCPWFYMHTKQRWWNNCFRKSDIINFHATGNRCEECGHQTESWWWDNKSLYCRSQPSRDRARRSRKRQQLWFHHCLLIMGFTLIELLVAAAIGLITTSVAGNVLIDQMKSSQRIEALQRQRDNWTRATDFISSEINLSERVYGRPANSTDPIPVIIPSTCNLSDA